MVEWEERIVLHIDEGARGDQLSISLVVREASLRPVPDEEEAEERIKRVVWLCDRGRRRPGVISLSIARGGEVDAAIETASPRPVRGHRPTRLSPNTKRNVKKDPTDCMYSQS